MYEQVFQLHAKLLKAIAHPRRLEIIHLLRDNELNVTEIVEMLDLPQANISQHLTILRNAGVVTAKKQGKQILYKIANKNFLKASDLIREVLVNRYEREDKLYQFSGSMLSLVPIVHDPVCKMRISPKTAGFDTHYHNKQYYFCASGCKSIFLKNPGNYTK